MKKTSIKTRMCQTCENLFYCTKKSAAKYCPTCRLIIKTKPGTGNNKNLIPCKICGTPFTRTGSKRTLYCSDNCRHIGRKQIILKCIRKRRRHGLDNQTIGTSSPYLNTKTKIVNGQERIQGVIILENNIKLLKQKYVEL